MSNVSRICPHCNKEFFTNQGQINAGNGIYCSRKCCQDYKNAHNKVTLICSTCGKEYQKHKIYAKESKYCSKKCKSDGWVKLHTCVDCGKKISCKNSTRCVPCNSKHRLKKDYERINNTAYIKFNCTYCGTEAMQKYNNYNTKSNHHFCNRECAGKWSSENLRGDKKGSYIDGGSLQPLYQAVRDLNAYSTWRKEVFTRDNYTCTCGQRGGYLEVHHKVTIANMIKKYKITTILDAIKCEHLWNVNNGITLCWNCHQKAHGKKERRAA